MAIASTLGLGACGGGFEADDPKGYEACEKFAEYHRDGDLTLDENVTLGDLASLAKTGPIKDATQATFDEEMMGELNSANPDVEQIYFVDKDKLQAACEDAGYKF